MTCRTITSLRPEVSEQAGQANGFSLLSICETSASAEVENPRAALNARDISWRRRCSARPNTWEQKVQQKVLGRRPVRFLERETGATLMLESAGGGTRVSAPAGIALCDWMAYVSRYRGHTWVRSVRRQWRVVGLSGCRTRAALISSAPRHCRGAGDVPLWPLYGT